MTLDAVVQHGLYVAIAQLAEPAAHNCERAGSLPAGGTKRPSGNRGLCHAIKQVNYEEQNLQGICREVQTEADHRRLLHAAADL